MSSNVINAINWRKQNEIYSKTIYVDVHEMVDCQKAWEINRGLKHQKPTGKGFVKMGIVYYLGSITVLEKFWWMDVNGRFFLSWMYGKIYRGWWWSTTFPWIWSQEMGIGVGKYSVVTPQSMPEEQCGTSFLGRNWGIQSRFLMSPPCAASSPAMAPNRCPAQGSRVKLWRLEGWKIGIQPRWTSKCFKMLLFLLLPRLFQLSTGARCTWAGFGSSSTSGGCITWPFLVNSHLQRAFSMRFESCPLFVYFV